MSPDPDVRQCQRCGTPALADAVEIERRTPTGERLITVICGACIEAGCVAGRCAP